MSYDDSRVGLGRYIIKPDTICSICGKSFIPAQEHMYKVNMPLREKGKNRYRTELQCSYTCWRKAREIVANMPKH
jgi:hypothetical protein